MTTVQDLRKHFAHFQNTSEKNLAEKFKRAGFIKSYASKFFIDSKEICGRHFEEWDAKDFFQEREKFLAREEEREEEEEVKTYIKFNEFTNILANKADSELTDTERRIKNLPIKERIEILSKIEAEREVVFHGRALKEVHWNNFRPLTDEEDDPESDEYRETGSISGRGTYSRIVIDGFITQSQDGYQEVFEGTREELENHWLTQYFDLELDLLEEV